jgi:hypothetical protein
MRELCLLGVILLVLSMLCAEYPELLTLCDNASNDFVLNASSPNHSSLLNSVASIVPADSNSDSCYCQLYPGFSSQVLSRTGRGLLSLYSPQRK